MSWGKDDINKFLWMLRIAKTLPEGAGLSEKDFKVKIHFLPKNGEFGTIFLKQKKIIENITSTQNFCPFLATILTPKCGQKWEKNPGLMLYSQYIFFRKIVPNSPFFWFWRVLYKNRTKN